MHMNTTASFTGRSVKNLSQAYWSLSDEEYEKYAAIGRSASQSHRLGATTFPIRSRRRECRRRGDKTHSSKPQTVLNMEQSVDRLEDELLAGHVLQFPMMVGDTDFRSSAMAVTNLLAKMYVEKQRGKEELSRTVLETLRHNPDTETILQCRRRLRELPMSQWTAFPHSCAALACSFQADQAVPADWVQHRDRSSGSTAMSQKWRAKHIAVKDSATSRTDPGKERSKACYEECFCHCKGPGKHLKTIMERLHRYCVLHMSEPRISTLFLQGFAVLHWCCITFANPAEPATPDSEVADYRHVFTHCSLCYQRPWRLTLTRMQLSDEDLLPSMHTHFTQGAPPNEVPKRLRFHVALDNPDDLPMPVTSPWEFLKPLNVNQKLLVRLWSLSDREVPCASVTEVCAHVTDVPQEVLWSGGPAESLARQRRSGGDIYDQEAVPLVALCLSF